MRKISLVTVLSAMLLGLIGNPVALATQDKESVFPATLQGEDPQRVFSLGDDTSSGISFSQLGIWPDKLCASTADPKCDFKNAGTSLENTIAATAILNVCSSTENEDCIKSIEISRDGVNFSKLEFNKYVVGGTCDESASAGCAFPPDSSKKLPRGGNLSIWSEVIDGKASELKFLVNYGYQMNYERENNSFRINEMGLSIRPMKEIEANRWDSLWYENGKSGIQFDYQPDVTMRATVHASNTIAGWFRARMQDINIDISAVNKRNSKIVVSGKSVIIPNFAIKREISGMSVKESALAEHFGWSKGVVGAAPGNSKIFEYLEYWRKALNDKAEFTNTQWSLNSTTWLSQNKCLNDTTKVVGVVSTNAMGFDSNTPKFQDGFLNYKVSGLHYSPDGVGLNLGTYDLVLRSDAARCLYKFSSAPISATVSISGADGNQNIATTVVSEKNGWLKMKAAGFTFSEKNIKVKLSQSFKSTITCVKAGMTKKVIGVSPKCPTGYKKKA